MKCKRAINFDLDGVKLTYCYPKNDIKQAWGDIEKIMTDEGFEHRQRSGYVSKKELSDAEVVDIYERMTDSLPWLQECANHFDVTNVMEELYDFLNLQNQNNVVSEQLEEVDKYEKKEEFLYQKVTEAEHKKLKDANFQFDTKRTEKGIVIRYSSQLKDKIEKTLSHPRGKQEQKLHIKR